MASEWGPLSDDRLAPGQLNAAISNALVRIQRDYLGRGPTRARAVLRDDMIVALMQDTLTKAELSLVANGRADEVRRTRRTFQHTMRDDIVAAVEELTGRKVIAFMSDTHIDPDIACEVILLEPEPDADEQSGGRDPAL